MSDEKDFEKSRKLSGVYRFFCWCSGARLYLLEKCPVDYNKYFGIGITIFLTGCLAAISGGWAIYYVFENIFSSILFGIFWGVLIFFIDWYLVSSLRKENKPYREVTASIPRFFLAILLAIVIAEPLKLKLFEREINQELVRLQSDKNINLKDQVFEEFDEIAKIENENSALREEISKKETLRQNLFERIIAEAEGRSVTGQVGKGPVYKEKRNEFETIDKDYQEFKERNLIRIDENNKRIDRLTQKRDKQLDRSETATANYDGILARLEAKGALARRNKDMSNASLFILILFICVESLPVFVKLISKRGPYDQLFEMIEGKQTLTFKKDFYEHKDKLQGELVANIESAQKTREKELSNNEALLTQMMDSKLEIQKEYLKKWIKEEKEKMLNGNGESKIEDSAQQEKIQDSNPELSEQNEKEL